MKKLSILLLFIFFAVNPVFAEIMGVQSIGSISTETPKAIFKLKVIKDCTLDGISLKEGYILEGKMVSVTKPKRLKKDATFTFGPSDYYDLENNKHHFPKLYIGTYSPKFEINAKGVAKSAVLSVGNHFVKGISSGFYAVEGAVKNEEGNRLKSAAENVYENSVFSYVEKGEQLHIAPNTCFGLKFDKCVNVNESN